jgi:hypothetical protein
MKFTRPLAASQVAGSRGWRSLCRRGANTVDSVTASASPNSP